MLPVFGRKVIKRKQRIAILDQALDRLVVFYAPGFDEGVECHEGILLGLGHPDLLERTLGFRLLALRQLVQDIGSLVHPAALSARLWPHFLETASRVRLAFAAGCPQATLFHGLPG